ncbi:MAG: MraY family glycosyltransferase [Geobacteraceae bacterium]|nr:MraY family glycosyltransferase [Geobacteraceae bacterium]
MIFLSTLLFSVFTTIALTPLLGNLAVRLQFVDIPDERKVHLRPIPRIGGIAMAVGALLPILYWLRDDLLVRSWLAGAAVLVVFGVIDDLRGLGPKAKLVGQIIAALIVVFYGNLTITSLGALLPDGRILPEPFAIPLTLLAIVGVTNAINLADGLDGLAGGICLLIFSAIGFMAYQAGISSIGFIALAMSGAIFGFLKFNTFPASVFMGDTGSQLLGFSAITLSLYLTQQSAALSPMLPLLLLGLPVLDTIYVMAARISRGVSPFVADRRHLHHRLLDLGLHHTESVMAIYLVQTAMIVAAYAFRFYPDPLLLSGYILFSAIAVYLSLHSDGIRWRIKRSGWYDTVFKHTLKRLRDEGTIIRHTFRIFEFGMPLLLLFSCLIPAQVPRYMSALSILLAAGILAARFLWKNSLGTLVRLALYMIIPFAVYLGEKDPSAWMAGVPMHAYNLIFPVFVVFIIVISKFSRRREGFKSTPMDFLVFFLAIAFTKLPHTNGSDYQTGLMAAKIIIFYFCFEVMLAELRGEVKRVAMVTLGALIVLGGKGLF